MSKKEKKQKIINEPQYYTSATNMPTYNYRVYNMKFTEKAMYFIIAFLAGAAVGYLFYGGIGKDEFDQPTKLTWILNIIIPSITGIIAGKLFVPIRRESIVLQRQKQLSNQFRDMLDAFNTSLGVGKNINESFLSAYNDLKIQYESDAFILKELEVIISGMQNNVAIEELLEDFGKRSCNDDIKSFANVFKTSYRKGGNIKEVIRNTHSILSDKMEISEDIETLVTANKLEQNIMIVMPIILILIIKLMSPEFAKNFVTPTGIISTTLSLIIFVVAYFMGKSVLNIKL